MSEEAILRAVDNLQKSLDGRLESYLTKGELDARLEKMASDIIGKVHPVAPASKAVMPQTQLTDPGTDQECKAGNRWLGKKSVETKLWTSDHGKKFGNIKNFLMANLGKKAYAGNDESTSGAGLELVPVEFYSGIVDKLIDMATMLDEISVIPMNSKTRTIPVGLTNPALAWVDEKGSVAVSKPTFDQIVQTARKLVARIQLTDELLEDAAFPLQSFLEAKVAEAIALEIERNVLSANSGSGDKFTGLLYKSGVVSVPLAGSEFDYEDIARLILGGTEANSRGAILYTSRAGLLKCALLRDKDGKPIWGAPVSAQPGTIMGARYQLSDQIPANLGAGNDQTAMFYGNFKRNVWLSPRNEMTMKASDVAPDKENDTSAWEEGYIDTKFEQRMSIDIVSAGSFRKMQF